MKLPESYSAAIPVTCFPAVYLISLAVLLLSVNNWSASSFGCDFHPHTCTYRHLIYRWAFTFTCMCVLLLVLSFSSNGAIKSMLMFDRPNSWRTYTVGGSWCTAAIMLFCFSPATIVSVYAAWLAPLLGLLWLVLQGYVLLRCALWMHKIATDKIRAAVQQSNQTMHDYFANKSTATAGANIQLSRWISAVYLIVHGVCMALAILPFLSGLFPSFLSTAALCISITVAIAITYLSAQREVNRGMLVPAVMVLYTSTLILVVLFADPNNPHNTSFPTASHASRYEPGETTYSRHSAELRSYVYANDVRLCMFYLVTVYYIIAYYQEYTLHDIRDNVLRAYTIARVQLTKWYGKYSARQSKRGADADLEEGDCTTDAHRDAQLIAGKEQNQQEAESLMQAEEGSSSSASASARVEDSPSSTQAATAGPGQYLSSHYARMLCLVGYTALLLTRWGAEDGADWVTLSDLRLMTAPVAEAARSTLTQQRYVLGVLLLSWLAVLGMYACSFYCTYSVRSAYYQARQKLQDNEFGHSLTAEVVGDVVVKGRSFTHEELGIRYVSDDEL